MMKDLPPQLNWLPLRYLNFAASLTIYKSQNRSEIWRRKAYACLKREHLPDQKQDIYNLQTESLQLLDYPVKMEHQTESHNCTVQNMNTNKNSPLLLDQCQIQQCPESSQNLNE